MRSIPLQYAFGFFVLGCVFQQIWNSSMIAMGGFNEVRLTGGTSTEPMDQPRMLKGNITTTTTTLPNPFDAAARLSSQDEGNETSQEDDDDDDSNTTTDNFFSSFTKATAFDSIVEDAYRHTFETTQQPAPSNRKGTSSDRPRFRVNAWPNRTKGGLLQHDRINVGNIYHSANSLFEYGLGESTYIADHVKVPYYAGIDSDPVYVSTVRSAVSADFRFYLADIGETGLWGVPKNRTLSKQVLHFQLAPLIVEPYPFDVYMVDGRFRFGCVMASFLHASARSRQPIVSKDYRLPTSTDPSSASQTGPTTNTTSMTTTDSNLNHTYYNRPVVLLHDCMNDNVKHYQRQRHRRAYKKAEHLFHVEHSGQKLCIYRRLTTTTDDDLMQLWRTYYQEQA